MKVSNKKFRTSMGLVVSAIALSTTGLAQACDLSSGGFLAAVVACAAPPLAPAARAADRLNGQLGNPVDHAAARVADSFVPGSGVAIEGYWAAQRSGALRQLPGAQGFETAPSGRGTRTATRQPALQPSFPAQNVSFNNGWNPPAPPMVFGVMCATQAGVFGPGAPLPVGASCTATTQYGYVAGFIVR